MIALRRLRQLAVGRRLDFETAVARRAAGTRIVMSDIGLRIDGVAAIDGGLHMHTLSETPVAFEHSVGYVNAIHQGLRPPLKLRVCLTRRPSRSFNSEKSRYGTINGAGRRYRNTSSSR